MEAAVSALDTHIGARITVRRDEVGWSVETAAARAGLSTSLLFAYEAGQQRVVAADLLALCRDLDVRPSYVFDGFSAGHDAADFPDAASWLRSWSEE